MRETAFLNPRIHCEKAYKYYIHVFIVSYGEERVEIAYSRYRSLCEPLGVLVCVSEMAASGRLRPGPINPRPTELVSNIILFSTFYVFSPKYFLP